MDPDSLVLKYKLNNFNNPDIKAKKAKRKQIILKFDLNYLY